MLKKLENIQIVTDIICDWLNIPSIEILTLTEKDKIALRDNRLLGYYCGKVNKKFYAIKVIDTNDIILVLHELAHHIQNMLYSEKYETPHDITFTLAENRIRTFLKRNYNLNFKNGFLR